MVSIRLVASMLALFGQLATAGAQAPSAAGRGPSTDPASTADLRLSPAQKQTIYTSIRNLNVKNEAPSDFQPIVGAPVPPAIKLESMPQTLIELTPQVKGFAIAMISGRVVIVEPKARRVVEVIEGEKN
jgi:hypothetical protein